MFDDINGIVKLYKMGFFPMADEVSGEIKFYLPHERAIFPIHEIKHSKSLIKFIKKNSPKITVNNDFRFVITQCSERETT